MQNIFRGNNKNTFSSVSIAEFDQVNISWDTLTIRNPSRPDPGEKEKIKLNFHSHTSLWYFKMFYEGLITFIFIHFSEMHGVEKVNKKGRSGSYTSPTFKPLSVLIAIFEIDASIRQMLT